MGKYSLAYDDVRTIMQTLYPNHKELVNPYDLESNPDIELKQSWGISIGSALNGTRVVCNRATITRNFSIVLARRSNRTRNDNATRIVTEKLLFEDLSLLVKYFEENPKTTNITRVRYTDDEGLDFVAGDRDNYLVLRSTLLVEYTETF